MNKLFIIFDRIKIKLLLLWEKYIAAYGKASKDGYKSNAFSPLVWFDVFVIPVLVVVTFLIKNSTLQYFLIGLIVFLILFTLLMYLLLFLKDPKLLQSEAYRIEDRKLDLIAQKGGEITMNPVDLIHNITIGGEE